MWTEPIVRPKCHSTRDVAVPASTTRSFGVAVWPFNPGASESGTIHIAHQGPSQPVATVTLTGRAHPGAAPP
jgi:hypothetical protein